MGIWYRGFPLLLAASVALSSPAHAQREGWWATASGGITHLAQSCPPDALSYSCGPKPNWGLITSQLGLGRQLRPGWGVGIDVRRLGFDVEAGTDRGSEVTSTVVLVTMTIAPAPELPFYLQAGLGGGRYRVVDHLGPTASVEGKGSLWAASITVGAEWDLVGPLRAGPYGRLDYAEFAEIGDLFTRLYQRLVSFGVAVTVR